MSITVKGREKRLGAFGDHHKFLQRIKKTLYYGTLPRADCLSLPVTELAAELFSQPQHGRSLERLQCNDAAKISRNACVSPCSFVLAMLYLERLKLANPEYLQQTAPSELFLVSLMISSKFLYDDGEEDQVFIDEWATSGGISSKRLVQLEKEFLNAIQWEIYVKDCSFWEKLVELEKMLAKREGSNRGWFTYTELENLLLTININDFLQYLTGLSMILIATYTIGLLTIAGAVFIVSNIPGNCLTQSVKNAINDNLQVTLPSSNETDITDNDPISLDESINNLKNHICFRQTSKPLDAVDVLKTGILLASIKSPSDNNSDEYFRNYFYEDSVDNDAEFVSWDWWSNPTMIWLAKASQFIETLVYVPEMKCFIYDRYQEMCIANCKVLDLEDQVHKATKIRIQDQIERSWHKEWTDVFKNLVFKRETLTQFIM